MNRKNEVLARVYIVMTFFVMFSLWIAIRLVDVNVIEGDKWRGKLMQNIKWREVEGERGSIFADDGSLLAASQPFFEVRFDLLTPKEDLFNKNVDSLAIFLAKDLGRRSARAWRDELQRVRKGGESGKVKGARYYKIANNVDYNQLLKIRNYPIFREGRFGGGIIEVQKSKRVKPFRQMASRTIGLDRVNAQKVGLEGYFDDYLKGQSAKKLYKKVAADNWIPVYEQDNALLNKGADLVTTINVGIQDVVHQAVMKKLLENRAQAGVGIVMDVETGAVKAMTSISTEDGKPYAEYFNYAMGWKGKYNPGSTFKLATVLAMLEDSYVNTETLVDLEKGVKYFGRDKMSDSEPHNHRFVSMEKAFVISSNVGIAKLANQFYNKDIESQKRFVRRLKSFGLSEKTEVSIEGESEPVIKDPVLDEGAWSGITIPWMAHGYELELTPLQLLTFYNAVANDGSLVKPFLVREILQEGETIRKFEKDQVEHTIANEYNIRKVQQMLEKVVQEGTARKLKNKSVRIAGKTGTSRLNYGAAEEEVKVYNASFAGYFPSEAPKYSCIVVMYGVSGSGHIYGSQAAAPVFGEIAEKIMSFEHDDIEKEDYNAIYASGSLPKNVKGYQNDMTRVLDYSNVPYEDKVKKNWIMLEKDNGQVIFDDLKINRKTIPDVRGMGIRDAIYILENLGLTVEVVGLGKVKSQSIAPGRKNTGGSIKLILN